MLGFSFFFGGRGVWEGGCEGWMGDIRTGLGFGGGHFGSWEGKGMEGRKGVFCGGVDVVSLFYFGGVDDLMSGDRPAHTPPRRCRASKLGFWVSGLQRDISFIVKSFINRPPWFICGFYGMSFPRFSLNG